MQPNMTACCVTSESWGDGCDGTAATDSGRDPNGWNEHGGAAMEYHADDCALPTGMHRTGWTTMVTMRRCDQRGAAGAALRTVGLLLHHVCMCGTGELRDEGRY